MKILYYDCFAGISGDMNLAAMLDLGISPEFLRGELSKLGLDDEFELQAAPGAQSGIHGTRVDVVLRNQPPEHGGLEPARSSAAHEHGHPHGPEHQHHHHHGHSGHASQANSHAHAHSAQAHAHSHAPNRNLADIEAIITASGLSDEVKLTSLKIFRKLAAAEAKVHAKPLDEVHFHEVGATDSLVDIVGAAICYHALAPDAVWASPLELGSGFARCAHGLIPVPAPATLELLHGIPTRRGGVAHEATTPTGAAILAVLVDEFTASPALISRKTGHGIGHRETGIPNLLRVQLAEPAEQAGPETVQKARLLQCNIDDMSAEMLGVAMDVLMEQGAMDVHFTPIIMKKNRPATCVSLLCAESDEERFKDLLFRHTTTLGIKSFPLDKTVLEVAFKRLETPLGPVRMKNAMRNGKVVRGKPELEDCRELANRHGLSLIEVYAQIAKCQR